MADQSNSKGFSLPVPSQGTADAQTTTKIPASQTTQTSIQVEVPSAAVDGPEPRDYAIAGAILLILLIGFVFVKGAYANHLVRKKVSPNAANSAGWWLFVFLSGLAIAVVMAILSPVKFMAPLFMAPLAVISTVALILMLVTGRQK